MIRRGLNSRLREAALRGDAKEARRLVVEGASTWIIRPRPMLVTELARQAGHEATAAAIDEAMLEEAHRRDERDRATLRARCTSVETLLANATGRRELVITRGAYSPFPQTAERWFFWDVTARGHLVRLRDAWIETKDIGDVERGLPSARWGDCDAMFAGRPRWIWAQSEGALQIWRRHTLVARADTQHVEVRRLRRWRRHDVEALDGVSVRLSADWSRHQVVLSGRGGDLPVASRRTIDPLVDPTYDRFMLWADASWAQSLADALGDVTKLPVDLPAVG